MDTAHFDRLTRRLSHLLSRRRLAGALVLTAATLPGLSAARKKRKRKKRKRQPGLVRNDFGCVDVGGKCRGNDANCCSGICEGGKPKKGKKDASRCVAHDVGSCNEAADICTGISPVCAAGALCFRTTGNASFCGRQGGCTVCRRDTDCEADFGPGAACAVCTAVCTETGTICTPAAA